jgi:hypothetical protein
VTSIFCRWLSTQKNQLKNSLTQREQKLVCRDLRLNVLLTPCKALKVLRDPSLPTFPLLIDGINCSLFKELGLLFPLRTIRLKNIRCLEQETISGQAILITIFTCPLQTLHHN